jgi:hypothetical protein
MELPEMTLPTDNIYKTSFCVGMIIIVFSFVPFYYYKRQVETEKVKLAGEIENIENKKTYLEEDSKRCQSEITKLKELRKGKFEEMPRLDPNTEEYKKFLEANGRKVEPNNPTPPIYIINVQKTKQEIERKHKIVQEIQGDIIKSRDELINTERNLSVLEVQIDTKNREILQTDRFVAFLLKIGISGFLFGILFTVYGGFNWWNKTQKWQDKSMIKQASFKKKK